MRYDNILPENTRENQEVSLLALGALHQRLHDENIPHDDKAFERLRERIIDESYPVKPPQYKDQLTDDDMEFLKNHGFEVIQVTSDVTEIKHWGNFVARYFSRNLTGIKVLQTCADHINKGRF